MAHSKPQFQEWESIFTTDSEPIAHFILGKLQNEGIEARIHKESVGSAFGIMIGLLGKVDVLVRSEDFDRAVAVLEGDDYEEDEEDEDDEDVDADNEGEDREI